METDKTKTPRGIQRRSFLKYGSISLLALPLLTKAKRALGKADGLHTQGYWQGPEGSEYFVQRTVDTGELDAGYIWARESGMWKRFQMRELDQKYWDWDLGERKARYIERQTSTKFTAGSPHSPVVCSYSQRKGRGDSQFHLNAAVKGMSAVPKKEYIKEINGELKARLSQTREEKLAYLAEIHSTPELWCKDKHAAVEYYSNPKFETHTFLNQMENPIATILFISYQGYVNYEIRSIVHLIHPLDPNITEEQKDMIEFPCMMFSFFHGEECQRIGAIYYHIEEFDNSPFNDTPGLPVV